MDARAFTIGSHIVFGAEGYAPQSAPGLKLIAHELAHTIQQSSGRSASIPAQLALSVPGDAGERAAQSAADAVVDGRSSTALAAGSVAAGATVQRDPDPNTVDATATTLIDYAQDASVPLATRGPELIRRLCATYYAADAALVSSIVYNTTEPGLSTTYTGTGSSLTGIITVGDYFVTNTTRAGIARRVLQLGHELEHIRQQRRGLGGGTHRHEREFLAFHGEATTPEKAGTGRMPHATRVSLIDAAIGNYNCLSDSEKRTYASQYQQLLTLRASEQTASGNAVTPAPTACAG
jgi:hypothetical protein